MTATLKLEAGKKYDLETLGTNYGWSDGDDSANDWRNVDDWFAADGTYKGPDCDGIEPTFLADDKID